MNRKILLATMFIIAILISSCSKKDEVIGEVKDHYLKVKIDGNEKSFATVKGRWVDGGNFLEITGNNSGNESIVITVMSDSRRISSGQYSLDDGSGFTILAAHSVMSSHQLNHTATRGTLAPEDAFNLKVDRIDNTSTEGSFSGVLVRVAGVNTLGTVTLTEGSFKTSIDPE